MSSSLCCTNAIDKWNLFELSIRKRHNNLPPICIYILISNFWNCIFTGSEIHIDIFQERVYSYLFIIQKHFNCWQQPCHIIDSFVHERRNIIIEMFHTKAPKIRVKNDLSVILTRMRSNLRLSVHSHILLPYHPEFLLFLTITTLNNEFMWEDVG